MSETCRPIHDWFNAALTFGLCCGLVVSYVPQHYRIIHKKSSEGFSAWFLLLGCTSGASGMLNMIAMQWGIVKCCKVVSLGNCLEMTAGVIQVVLVWAMFGTIQVLYMIYYPPHLKYDEIETNTHDVRPPRQLKAPVKSDEWRLSVILAWVVIVHLVLTSFTTFILLLRSTPSQSPGSPLPHEISQWATFLGVSSAMLAAVQYAPQLLHTYKTKLVGALSIPMMLIQSPGAILMVTSIALRPGTNWTSWITFAVAGMMQGSLLVMCIMWKIRQRRLEIDDFGYPLNNDDDDTHQRNGYTYDDEVPGLVLGDEDPIAVQVALANALESAVESNVLSNGVQAVEEIPITTENTPLLQPTAEAAKPAGWFSVFGRRKEQ